MSSISLEKSRAEMRDTDYLQKARELAPILAAASDEIEELRELPERIVEALIEGGFFRMLLPRSLGGAELDPLTYGRVRAAASRLRAASASPGAGDLPPAAGMRPGSARMCRSSSRTARRA